MEKRLDTMGIIYGVLFSPVDTMKNLVNRPPLGIALVIFLITNAIAAAVSYPALSQVSAEFARVSAVAGAVLGVLFMALGVSLVHLSAELLGGQGRVTVLLCVMLLASLPEVFTAPLLVVGRAMPVLSLVGSVGLSIWVLVLSVIGIREAYGFSTGRAVLAWLLPGLFVFAGFVILVVLLGVLVADSAVLEEILQGLSEF
ncbi:MAG: Yip1 family protein [Bacillota bacterium]